MEIIRTSNYLQALDEVLRTLSLRAADLSRRHVVLVPDRFTLETERKILEAEADGFFDIEVVTLSRLIGKIGSGGKAVSKSGAVMLVRSIVDAEKDRLEGFFAHSSGRNAAEALYAAIAQLKSCGIRPCDIREGDASGAIRLKLADLKHIYGKYEEALGKKGLADSSDKMSLIIPAVKNSGYIKDAYIYMLGFDALPYLAGRFLREADKYARAVKVYTTARRGAADGVFSALSDCCDTFTEKASALPSLSAHINENLFRVPYKQAQTDKVHIYNGGTPAALYAAAARIIKKAVSSDGLRYRDIAVVGDADAALTGRFGEYKIPVNADRRIPASEHPLSQYILKLLEINKSNRERGRIFDLVKNLYFREDADGARDAAAFENYCLKYNINYSGFDKAFDRIENDDERPAAEAAERVRKRVVFRVSELIGKDSGAVKNDVRCRAIAAHLESIKAAEITDRLGKRSDGGYKAYNEQIGDCMKGVLNEITELIGEEKTTVEDFLEILRNGLSARKIAVIPGKTDAVTVAPPEGFRFTRYRLMLVVNCNDGVIPKKYKDEGVISDKDIDTLSQLSLKIEPRIREVNDRAREDAVNALSVCDELYLLYANSAGGDALNPSPIVDGVKRLFPGLKVKTDGDERKILDLDLDDNFFASYAASCFGSYGEAEKAFLARYYGALQEGAEKLPKVYEALYAVIGGAVFPDKPHDERLLRARELYFSKGRTSITTIEDYFKCPYMFFNRRGLRLTERKDGSLQSNDVGNILHELAERYFKDKPFSFEDAYRYVTDKYEHVIPGGAAFRRRFKEEARELISAIDKGITDGGYTVLGAEVGFGDGKDYPAYLIPHMGGVLSLTGKIDRADVMSCANGDKYVRVVDYKTGKIEFDYSDIYYGAHIQLPAYLSVLMKEGCRPAGVYFLPVNNDYSKENVMRYRMLGLTTTAEEPALAMDNALIRGEKTVSALAPVEVDENGALKTDGLHIPEEDFRAVCEYVARLVEGAAAEITDGNIIPSPKDGVCGYCEYFGACPRAEARPQASVGLNVIKEALNGRG